ncbi:MULTISPECIES: hypothetical protein [Larkinella]|uniref:hypothetical protein n=1 Tax=Larkinella TaxID=332157 RepID=UPI0014036F72|nr:MULTISPECIES: hypothetical protein [Larkinella]
MGLIKEPKDVDFIVDGRDLTLEEHQKISEYIRMQKKLRQQKTRKRPTKSSKNYA